MSRALARALLCTGALAAAHGAWSASAVPYRGCDTDVMGGSAHYAAPRGQAHPVNVTAATALRLSFYQALMSRDKTLPGVFGPRDWHCYAYMGDGIGELIVSPLALKAQYSGNDPGPGLSLTSLSSETGAGFTFAYQVISAYFPQHLGEFLRTAGAATGNTFSKSLPRSKPHAGDLLRPLGDWSVLVTTPARQSGFGTQSGWFAPGALPVQTLIVVDSVDYWIYELRIRLAEDNAMLLPAILQAEPAELRGR